ncbi:MAG: DUF6624 domain-containing protein [Planctomycetota bacterium]
MSHTTPIVLAGLCTGLFTLSGGLAGCASRSPLASESPPRAPGASVQAGEVSAIHLSDGQLAEELRAMGAVDRGLLESFLRSGPDDPALNERIRATDRAHAARLSEIVDSAGWPTADRFGREAADAAFAIVQHAGHDIAFMTECRDLMMELVDEGRMEAPRVALLTDRIRLFEGRPQLYGTQMTFDTEADGGLLATPSIPIENPRGLNDRRAVMGLPPHEWFSRTLEVTYAEQTASGIVTVQADTWSE